MITRIIFFMLLISLVSCTGEIKEKKEIPLNQPQIELVKEFASKMAESMNQYQYDVARNAWNKNAFKARVDVTIQN